MTDDQLELRLKDWYRAEIPPDEAAPLHLRSSVALIPGVSTLPRRRFMSKRAVTLVAAAALIGVLAATAAIGARLVTPPVRPVVPPAVPTEHPSLLPSGPESEKPAVAPPTDQIIYTRKRTLRDGEEDCTTVTAFCHRANVLIADADGSNERELLPGRDSSLLAVSPDGSEVIVQMRDSDGDRAYLTDRSGTEPEPLDAHCDATCFEDQAFAFSPDGGRLAFVRWRTDETPVIAIMDRASGSVEELGSTIGIAAPPSWSPDGSRLAFNHYVVDTNGGDLGQFAPDSLFSGLSGEPASGYSAPQWSPDGSLIAFASFNDTFPTDPPERNSQRLMDIYVVRPDGADLRRLTTETVPPLGTNEAGDFGAAFPNWTRRGQITFIRFPVPPETDFQLWAIDPDGTDATLLDFTDAAALTAVGCVTCTYSAIDDLSVPNFAYWIPGR